MIATSNKQTEKQARVQDHEHEPREHVGRAVQRREVRDVGDDESDERDADRRDLRVVTRAPGSEIAIADDRDERTQHAEPQRVELRRSRAEHEIDARNGEHEISAISPDSRARGRFCAT